MKIFFGLILAGLLLPTPARAQLEEAPPVADLANDSDDAVAKRDIFDVLNEYVLGRRIEPQLEGSTARGLQWSFVPTVSYNPVYGTAVGALMSGAGRRGDDDSPYSSVALSANYSTQEQIQIQLRGDLFSTHETYLMKFDCRYLDTSRSTWGLGGINQQQGEYPMSFVLGRMYATFLRKLKDPVYFGFGFHYDEFWDVVDDRAAAGESTPYTDYSGSALSSTRAVGFSLNLLADTRDNLVDARSGYFLNWSLRDYLTSLGSDQNWQEMWIEARMYPHFPTASKNTLAFWMYTWMTFGPAPYLNLPTNGWDTYGRGARGYLAGRIRGANQLYLESEYRRSLTRDGLLGLVLFVNATSTTSTTTGTFGRIDPGVGTGLRVKFNKHNSTNLAVDYAWGRSESRGLFLGLAEVF